MFNAFTLYRHEALTVLLSKMSNNIGPTAVLSSHVTQCLLCFLFMAVKLILGAIAPPSPTRLQCS